MPHILVVARDPQPIYRVLNRTGMVLAGGTLLTLGLGFLLIDRVVRTTLRPIDALTAQMKDRAGHQLDCALDVPGQLPAELVGLAENFDSLLGRVAAIRQRERDFIRHAAHELRTPIAGLRATAELALSQPREASAYAAHLETCRKSAVELGELVKRLSALSRVGQENLPQAHGAIDIAALLTDCMAQSQPLFGARGITVMWDFPAAPLVATGDVALIRIIFNNLLDNILSYATPGSEARVLGRAENGNVEIRIANKTDDLPENPERLFEPLFRRNASRDDAGEHLGIGLTLSLDAATAMGATLQALTTNEGWIEFVLKFREHNASPAQSGQT